MTRGTVALVVLDPVQGHEQRGSRPCVIVSDPEVAADQRFPLLCAVPLTSTPGTGALYPAVEAGPSGLARRSHALTDQVRSVDKRRVKRVYGQVSRSELEAIELGLRLYLGLL